MERPATTQTNQSDVGALKISEDVVAVIAGVAAAEVKGVTGMSGGIVGDISEILGKKNLSKGVKVDIGGKETSINMHVVVEYGVRIPEVAQKVQEKVKRAVEDMTGLKVREVNIHIQGVSFRGSSDQEVKQAQALE